MKLVNKMNLIISGSITSGYGISAHVSRWDEVFRDQLSEKTFESVCMDGMTHESAFDILCRPESNGELLILYFGTRIGWPRIGKLFDKFLLFELKNSGYLDLSVFNSLRKGARMRRISKRITRILLKSLGILLRLYKPELPKDKVLQDLDLLLTIAAKNFNWVIYIQHHHLSTRRLRYESKKYEKYYSLLLSAVRSRPESNILLVEMPKDIFSAKFFLLDCVHYSDLGHNKFGSFLAKTVGPLIKKK
jgi:hypothetical protein